MRRLVSTERVKLIAKCEELLDQLRDHEDNAKLRALTDDIEKLCERLRPPRPGELKETIARKAD
jgi:hypothetical protein